MNKKWWHEAVMYEIYTKSFCDSNGDGIGDLKGVKSKLPILKELGVNVIWFTPIYKSPQVDNGYDVADYRDIDPAYGTLDDFKDLLDTAHSMGIRVVMDMVLNHSSDECEWFRESKKSKDNPYRNFYIWQPPKADGTPPNNWGNYFQEGDGSAWTFDEATGEYYLHQYSAKMPDLNWEYQPLRQAVYDMLNWWLDMGVDGFRFDIFTRLKKPAGFPDSLKTPDPKLDINGFVADRDMCTCVDGIHEIWQEIHKNVFEGRDCFSMGEGSGLNADNAVYYVGQHRKEVDSAYIFTMIGRKKPPFTPAIFRNQESAWYEKIMRRNGWLVQYMCNHDQPRMVSHYGNDREYRVESAKLLATLVHTTPGMPIIYQGEEIGMTNIAFDNIEDYNDCYTKGDYYSMVKNGVDPKEALAAIREKSRDNARSPYLWDDSENAGFTSGKPWLKISNRAEEINYAADRNSENSIFDFYKKLTEMRKTEPAIIDGDLKFYLNDSDELIVYTRSCARQTLLIVANKSDLEVEFEMPEELKNSIWKRILSNRKGNIPAVQSGKLMPWEAEVYELDM